MAKFITSQVMGGIALVLVVISVCLKNKKQFFVLQTVANIFYALSFVFADAMVAGINSFISCIRVVILFFYEKMEKQPPLYLLVVFSAIYLTIGAVFYTDAYDFITIITPIVFTIAMFMKNMQLVRILMIPPNILLVLFAILHQVYTTAILDAFEVVFLVSALIFYAIKEKKTNQTLNP